MKTYEAIEAMVIPVGGEPETRLLVSDGNGSFRSAVERILGGEAEPITWPFGDSPAMFQRGGRLRPCMASDANRAVYADAAMADMGVRSPAEPWRSIREGEFHDVTFGTLVCVGIAGEWGGCRSLTAAERDRVIERFGGAEAIASGQLEARRLTYGTPFDDAA